MTNNVTLEQACGFVNEMAARHNQIKDLLEQVSGLQNRNAEAINGFVTALSTAVGTTSAAPTVSDQPFSMENLEKKVGAVLHSEAPTPTNSQNHPQVGALPAHNTPASALTSSFEAMHAAIGKLNPAQPTTAQPVVGSSQPTAAVTGEHVPEGKPVLEQMRDGWKGPRSIIAQLLSPTCYSGGRGMVAPGVNSVLSYNEDVMTTPLKQVTDWPSGFYVDSVTKETQFFLNLSAVCIFVERLPSCTGNVSVAFKTAQGTTQRVNIDNITAEHEMKFALDSVWSHMQQLSQP